MLTFSDNRSNMKSHPKLRPLGMCQRVLSWLCVCPCKEGTLRSQKILYRLFLAFLIIVNLVALSASLVFFVKFATVDMEASLYALFQISGVSNMTQAVILTYIYLYRVMPVFNNLQEIYNALVSHEDYDYPTKYLLRANRRSERYWKMYFIFGSIAFSVSLLILPAISVVWYGGFDSKKVYRPYKLILPWDQSTVPAFIAEVIGDFVGGCGYDFGCGVLLILFSSICLQHRAFYKIFKRSLAELKGSERRQYNSNILRELVYFRMTVQAWFQQTAELYSPYVLFQLITFMMFLACNIFQLDLEFHHIGFSITILIAAGIVCGLNLFGYCYFGKMATESFEKMADSLFEADWPCLPVQLQRYFIVMIANAQRPIHYHGSGLAHLNLETFVKMLRAVVSYYMMFKTITSK